MKVYTYNDKRTFSLKHAVLTQSLIPVVMSGIIAVYGLVVAVLLAGQRKKVYYIILSFTNALS